jgi:hypothetical protein
MQANMRHLEQTNKELLDKLFETESRMNREMIERLRLEGLLDEARGVAPEYTEVGGGGGGFLCSPRVFVRGGGFWSPWFFCPGWFFNPPPPRSASNLAHEFPPHQRGADARAVGPPPQSRAGRPPSEKGRPPPRICSLTPPPLCSSSLRRRRSRWCANASSARRRRSTTATTSCGTKRGGSTKSKVHSPPPPTHRNADCRRGSRGAEGKI